MTSAFPGGGHGATEESPGSRDRGRHSREAPGLGLLVPGALKAHFQLRAAWLGCSVRKGVLRQERGDPSGTRLSARNGALRRRPGPRASTPRGCVNPTQFAGDGGGLRFPETHPGEYIPGGTWEQVCLTVTTRKHWAVSLDGQRSEINKIQSGFLKKTVVKLTRQSRVSATGSVQRGLRPLPAVAPSPLDRLQALPAEGAAVFSPSPRAPPTASTA